MSQSMGRVLVVDDQDEIRDLLSMLLRKQGLTVDAAANGLAACTLLDTVSFDAVVSDINMPGMDGMSLLRRVRVRDLDLPLILMTGLPSIESATEAVAFGAFRYLLKPLDLAAVVEAVQHAIRLRRLAQIRREAGAHLGTGNELPSDRAGLEARFSVALDGLWMAHQPVVSQSRRDVFAYEALVRSDEQTMAIPATLLRAGERLGRLRELGRQIRTRVAEGSAAVSTNELLFVNLNAVDLLDDALFDPHTPFAALASRVVLEITERASLDDIHDLPDRVTRLRAMGFRIAVDDLGAGYSGLSAVVQLQPDVIKLDMSLVRGVDSQPTKQRLVQSMAALCRDMGTLVVAEGVEVAAERDTLVDLGCDLLQGFLFARPARHCVRPAWAA